MNELEKKINKASDLQKEVKLAHQNLMMKSGLLDDLMKDICTDLGFPKDQKEIALPEMLQKVYVEANK